MFKNYIYFLIVIFSLTIYCNNTENKVVIENSNLEKANNFSVEKKDSITKILVKTLTGNKEYFLSAYNNKKTNNQAITIPIKRVICLSTTHIAFIDKIGETNSIIGVSGSKYIFNESLRKRIKNGEIKDVGYGQNLDYETIINLKPDVIFIYDVSGEASSIISKLESLKIKTIIVNEFSEKEILGQTEWIKFFSEFYNKRNIADSIYNSISRNYESTKKLITKDIKRPKVMTNLPWKGTWYVANGESNTAKLISDAGGDYIWSNTKSKSVLAINIEEVFKNAKDADFWINTGQANSIEDIRLVDKRIQLFHAIKKGNIFNRNKRINSYGGNDYMESGIVNPDRILKDLIKIFHPDLIDDDFYYYQKLK